MKKKNYFNHASHLNEFWIRLKFVKYSFLRYRFVIDIDLYTDLDLLVGHG